MTSATGPRISCSTSASGTTARALRRGTGTGTEYCFTQLQATRTRRDHRRQLDCLPAITSTLGRIHCELLRLLFLHAHRETTRFFEILDDEQALPNNPSFTYRRAAFFNTLKRRTSLVVTRAAALRININTNGRPLLTKKRGELPASFARPTYSLPLEPPTFTSQ